MSKVNKKLDRTEECVSWLTGILEDGPRRVVDLVEIAENEGFTRGLLFRASRIINASQDHSVDGYSIFYLNNQDRNGDREIFDSTDVERESNCIRICGNLVDVVTPRCELMTFDPQTCEEILRCYNNANRKPRRNRSDRYALDMKRGQWVVNGETVKFSRARQLLDGQNRLMACILAGVPFDTWVAFGLDPDAFCTIDTGLIRSGSDVLFVQGEANVTNLAATLSVIWLHENGKLDKIGRTAPQPVLLEVLLRHPGVREACSITNRFRGDDLLTPRLTAFCFYWFSKLDCKAAEKFFLDLRDGVGLDKGDPVLTLRSSLINNKGSRRKMNAQQMLAFVIKAWNARRKGKKIVRNISWISDGPSPEPFPSIM